VQDVYELEQNFPNPFNPSTNISFSLPEKSFVKLIVYNALGNTIEVLVNQELNAGKYRIGFDGIKYPSGIYFYKLETDKISITKRMVLLK
jgi:hypothetical protein